MRASLLLAAVVGSAVVNADKEGPQSAADWLAVARKHYAARRWADAQSAVDKCLSLDKDDAAALQLRGSVHFMRGQFKDSVADFDRVIALRPKEANGHWQRGISLYYAGKYAEGMKQFNAYEKVSTTDVENGVWHFLCAAKKDGVAKARQGMLKIGHDDRVPMMKVYALFKGEAKPADVLAEAKAGRATEELRNRQLFYAHLYLGLYYDVSGDAKKAKEHLALAASDKLRIAHYMGEVARVHLEVLNKAKK